MNIATAREMFNCESPGSPGNEADKIASDAGANSTDQLRIASNVHPGVAPGKVLVPVDSAGRMLDRSSTNVSDISCSPDDYEMVDRFAAWEAKEAPSAMPQPPLDAGLDGPNMGGNADEDLDNFLRGFSAEHEVDDRLCEVSLREWIERRSQPQLGGGAFGQGGQMSCKVSQTYVKSALPIALKLTECLIEAEREERNGNVNPIPIASIAASNVLIRAREHRSSEENESGETIDYVWIMSCLGDNPDCGERMHRLFALGTVLYELFAAEQLVEDEMPHFNATVGAISLNEGADQLPPRKKSQRQTTGSDDTISNRIARLEMRGIPWSLCTLMKNLLDCSNGDFCSDDAYASLEDLRSDLQLLLNDPRRFLDNIDTNPIPQLSICDKIYGRDDEAAKLEKFYQQHISGGCSGVIISGGAGMGKSKLAREVMQRLLDRSGGHFLVAKFDENQELKPLSTIGGVFNALCDQFVEHATPTQLESVEEALERALGSQASLLAGIVPSLPKLMPSLTRLESADCCVDSALSMRFQLGALLRVVSSHCRHIVLLLDDIHWADAASLLLIGNLLSSVANVNEKVFFVFCHRDDKGSKNKAFDAWLGSIEMFPLGKIPLGSISGDGVNRLVSDALRLSPRITRSLSSVLHHKTGGNPFFLTQMLHSLNERNLIYVSLHPPRWAWDLDAIMDLKISDDVVALLTKEIQNLSPDLQLGLKVASCIGSFVSDTVVAILSKDLRVELVDALQNVTQKGYMDNDGTTFRFAHDKIQQASSELMTEQERREYHMRFGLALCSYAMDNGGANNELESIFFLAVHQMNRGGPGVVHNPQQKNIIAELNLKAGRQSIELSDYNTAYRLFEHGMSFLGSKHWDDNYRLSIGLFDAAAEAACMLNNCTAVTLYSEQLFAHAKCFDDKMNCLYTGALAFRHARRLEESIAVTNQILTQLGEKLPRAMGDESLSSDMQVMNGVLRAMTDDSILNMHEATDKKTISLLKLYANLVTSLTLAQPSLVGAVSLRMVDLVLKSGLTFVSPSAFAAYGEVLTSMGYVDEGCRLGKLALKLLEKKGMSTFKSSVILGVYQSILWAVEPLQSLVEGHLLGHKSGQQTGDVFFAQLNLQMSIQTNYIAGRNLDSVLEDIQSSGARTPTFALLYWHALALKGSPSLDKGRSCPFPSEGAVLAKKGFKNNKNAALCYHILHLQKAFLFRQLDGISLNIWDEICEQQHLLRPIFLMGIFFEGLAAYQIARRSIGTGETEWIARGDSIATKMKRWSERSSWNWANKAELLLAEKMHTVCQYEEAAALYERAVRSAREHQFQHEEAIASELAGMFFFERGMHQKAIDFLMHSIQCYKDWGATAVAKRVQSFIASKYGSGYEQLRPRDIVFDSSSADNSMKRRPSDVR